MPLWARKADVNGVQKAYPPSRFRQALDMAPQNGGYLAYVERLLLELGPAQGMTFRLVAEGLEHLTVEAQVVDKSKPYQDLFSAPADLAATSALAPTHDRASAARKRSVSQAAASTDRSDERQLPPLVQSATRHQRSSGWSTG